MNVVVGRYAVGGMDQALIELVECYRQSRSLADRQSAASQIIEAVAPTLRGQIGYQLPVSSVDDVWQETLMGIARNLHMFRGQTDAEFWGWCRHVALNKIRDHLRRLSREPLVLMDMETLRLTLDQSVAQEPISASEHADLERARALLEAAKPLCRELLWRRYVLEWAYARIGQAYGITPDAARMQVQRCLTLAQKSARRER